MPNAILPAPASRPVEEAAALVAFHALLNIFNPVQSGKEPDWDKAVPWSCLQAMGLDESQIQKLLAAGHLQHRLETTKNGKRGRTFKETQDGAFTPRSCFVLTASGFAYAQELFVRRDGAAVSPLNQPHGDRAAAQPWDRPCWIRETGELWLDGQLLKRFCHPAANQRFLLDALEGAGWPCCLPNPFHSSKTRKPKRCLHRTMESLNRGQRGTPHIRFGGDGQGCLRWERVN